MFREDDSIPLADEDASGRVDDSMTDNIPEDLRKVFCKTMFLT